MISRCRARAHETSGHVPAPRYTAPPETPNQTHHQRLSKLAGALTFARFHSTPVVSTELVSTSKRERAACAAGMSVKIESLHWIRDILYREDASTARTRSGLRVMAALRNLAVGAHRLAGRTHITEAIRWAGREMRRPFQILNLDNES